MTYTHHKSPDTDEQVTYRLEIEGDKDRRNWMRVTEGARDEISDYIDTRMSRPDLVETGKAIRIIEVRQRVIEYYTHSSSVHEKQNDDS